MCECDECSVKTKVARRVGAKMLVINKSSSKSAISRHWKTFGLKQKHNSRDVFNCYYFEGLKQMELEGGSMS